MLRGTLGSILVNSLLPEDLRDYNATFDAKTIKSILQKIAEKYPDRYREIASRLVHLGRELSYLRGGFSFGLRHMKVVDEHIKERDKLRKQIDQILDSSLSPETKRKKVLEVSLAYKDRISKLAYDKAVAEDNPLVHQVVSGSRGKVFNVLSLIGSDMLYQDHKDRPIPMPVLRSYSEGLSPAEYFAGSFGARKGVIDTKLPIRNAGFLSKQLSQVAHRLIVTAVDEDEKHPLSRIYQKGYPVDVEDPDNEGALLAFPAGGYPRDTVLTPAVLADLKKKGVKKIVVRSAITSNPPDGGVYAKDVGVREKGSLPPIGDFVGIAAAQALAEPISQSSLNSKHSGGIAGADKSVSGFKAIDQFLQVPEAYPGGAAHAELDGRVEAIKPAPAGGTYIVISGREHYVPPGYQPLVKAGDEVEAGDRISEGLPNPAKVVQHKGIGEGRRYFTEELRKILTNSGIPAHRRNIELLSRGVINYVQAVDSMDDYVPGDLIRYDALESRWTPRDGYKTTDPKQAVGMYLEEPVLHYTIGTRITPRVANTLKEFNIKHIRVHPEPPPFVPVMERSMDYLMHDPDWMVRFLGSNLKRGLIDAVTRSLTSDPTGTSFVPAYAEGAQFGRRGKIQTFVKKVPPPGVYRSPPPAALTDVAELFSNTATSSGSSTLPPANMSGVLSSQRFPGSVLSDDVNQGFDYDDYSR
jgi:hypothetical protein